MCEQVVAMYIRLSSADSEIGKTKDESDSVSNQKNLINNFLDGHRELAKCKRIYYIDDGFSGVNYKRPAFISMMDSVRTKNVNVVIVKDLSRLGRSYVETSRYIHNIFPFMKVRFIAINDNIDSKNDNIADFNMVIDVKNIMNDAYLRDISIKVRTQLEVKRKKGDFIGAFAPYGYLRDCNNKNKIIVDETAENVIISIYKMKLDGLSPSNIADLLNKNGILSPAEHKKALGTNFVCKAQLGHKALWSPTAVLRVLHDEIYIGTLSQGKYTTPNYKVKKVIYKPKDEWVSVKNNHESIITEDMFYNVQEILALDTRTSPDKGNIYTFSGLIYCADCENSMIRKNNGSKNKPYFYYVCSGHKNKKCESSHIIKVEMLEESVYSVINKHISCLLNSAEILGFLEELPYANRKINSLQEMLELKRIELESMRIKKLKVFESYTEKLISEDDYKNFFEIYTEKYDGIEENITYIESEINNLLEKNTFEQKQIDYFKKYLGLAELNRKLIVSLISRIFVTKNKELVIKFKFGKINTWNK